MRKVIAEFETVYAKVNHRVSRYGEAGYLDHRARPDRHRRQGQARPASSARSASPIRPRRTRACARPISADAGTRRNLYEMDLLQPGHEVIGPAIIEHPATTLVVHPQDRVTIDEWTLLHYSHA